MSKHHIHPRHEQRKKRQPQRIKRLLYIAKSQGKCGSFTKLFIRFKLLCRSIIMIHDSPHAIALGVAIGMIVGFSPTVGLQMIIAATIATLCGANRLTAIIPVWITNPITIPPIYAFTYYLGGFLIPGENQTDIYGQLQKIGNDIKQYGFTNMIAKFKLMLDIGAEAFIQMSVGGLILGGGLALACYPLTIWLLGKSKRFKNRQKIIAQLKADKD